MKKFNTGLGLFVFSLLSAATFFGAKETLAFGKGGHDQGERGMGRGMMQHEMSAEQFAELKALINQSATAEEFQAAMQTKRKAQMKERQAMQDKVNHEVSNIENGVVRTVTSNDADVVAKLHKQADRMADQKPRQEEVAKTVEKLSNGFQVTLTSDNADIVKRLQNDKFRKNGKHKRNNQENDED